ncbi:hypothetical protein AB1N83_006490 [Pleurotus pulmonarius]
MWLKSASSVVFSNHLSSDSSPVNDDYTCLTPLNHPTDSKRVLCSLLARSASIQLTLTREVPWSWRVRLVTYCLVIRTTTTP